MTGLFVVMAATGNATEVSQCAAFPESDFWSKTTHSTIISYVNRKHDGNWKDYIAKWQKQLDNMRKIYEQGGSAVFKSKNMTISGDELMEYIKALETRVEVTKCVASWQK
ncbi:MAG: hypothetical protein ACTSV1_01405 [Alphaproteobacteria bacterium]